MEVEKTAYRRNSRYLILNKCYPGDHVIEKCMGVEYAMY